jgi:hypothetical protein
MSWQLPIETTTLETPKPNTTRVWNLKSKTETFSNIFFDKGNILISKYIHYTQPLQQRNALIALRMHIAKKEKDSLDDQHEGG